MKVGLFPGQGVPIAALLQSLEPGDPVVTAAAELLGHDLHRRVETASRGGRSALPTSVAQPAIFVASVASFLRSTAEERACDFFLGHSLGEYAALAAGGAMSFEHGLSVVVVRAAAMERAARNNPGGMVAVLGLDLATVTEIAGNAGVTLANDNAPGQVVLSGTDDALADAASRVASLGGRAVRLEVAGPFHTEAMDEATLRLRDGLDHTALRSPKIPVIANISARPYRAPGEIRALLLEQLTGRVRFRESLQWAWEQGVRSFVDFGPGRIVAGLAQRTFAAFEQEAVVGG